MFTKNNKGFTLIELLVVIAIIGVLSSIVLVSMGGARVDARNVARKSAMRQVITAQEMYYGSKEAYKTGAGSTAGTIEITGYLDILHDGKGGTHPDYVWLTNTGCTPDGEYFCAYATLEGTTTMYYAASQKGTKELTAAEKTAATGCACW